MYLDLGMIRACDSIEIAGLLVFGRPVFQKHLIVRDHVLVISIAASGELLELLFVVVQHLFGSGDSFGGYACT